MFGDNPNDNVPDPELEAAQRSMRGRIDPDDEEKLKEEEKPEEKKPDPAPVVDDKDKDPKADPNPEADPKPEDDKPDEDDSKPTNRPETHIPLPKYLEEKKQWKEDRRARQELEARVKELEDAGKSETTPKDVEEFAEKHNLEVDMVKDLFGIVESKLLPAEKQKQIDEALKIAEEKKQADQLTKANEQFTAEFTDQGIPAIKKLFPNATDEQIAQAKAHLDKVAHTKEYNTTKLKLIVVDQEDALSKIFTTEAAPADKPTDPPLNKKGMEHGRSGGKNGTTTAADFKGKEDFSSLLELDPTVQEQIRKEMDMPTYKSYLKFMNAKEKEGGIEVMRNGRKITLK